MKTRDGYEWVETKSGGFWVKTSGNKHKHKLPMFCPYEGCRRITSTIDDEYLLRYGICWSCYSNYVEERQTPLIDVEHYAKRLRERGY